jgi:hypothetical protein
MVTAFEKDAAMKKFTEEDAQRLAEMLGGQVLSAIQTWESAMKVLPISSKQYKAICKAGLACQDAYHAARSLTEERLGMDVASRFFTVGVYCGFS